MRILYVDINYLFNKMLHKTIEQQRVKYSHKQMPKNMIILNKYNLVLDTTLSITTLIDKCVSNIADKYDAIYIFNTNLDVCRKLPNKYNTGYYIQAYKRFGTVNDIIDSNMYTTKLVKSCLSKLAHNKEITVAIERAKGKKNSRKELFRLNIAKNVISTINEYAKFYERKYKEKWQSYNETTSANKTSKISHYLKDFRMNTFTTQNFLTNDEIKSIYKYIVKCCNIKHTKVNKFELTDDRVDILSDKLFTDKSIHMEGNRVKSTNIKYISINRKTGKIGDTNMIYKLRNQSVTKMSNFEKSTSNMLSLVLDTKNKVWMNNIIDIDQNNYINLFTEHTQNDLYNKTHTKSILTEYNYMQNYKNINTVDENFYVNYLNKVLKNYKFEYFKLV